MKKTACRYILILLLLLLPVFHACGEGASLSVDPTGLTEGFSAILYDNRNTLDEDVDQRYENAYLDVSKCLQCAIR